VVLCVLALALLASACSSDKKTATTASASASSGAAAKKLVIADLESLTGPGASVGVPQSNAVKLAVEEINNAGGIDVGGTKYTIELSTEDDKSDPTAGVTAVQKFLSDGRKFMVGTLSSAVVGAYLPIVQDNPDFISLIMGAALEGITDHPSIYRPRVTLSQYTSGLSDYLATLSSVKKVALLTDKQHAGFVQQLEPFKQKLTAKGIQVVADESYTFGATDFGPQLTAMLRGNPDALNFRGYPADVTRAIKQAREQGFTGPIYTTSGITKKEVDDAQSADAMTKVQEVYAPLPTDLIEGKRNDAVAKAFEDAYQAKFGTPSGGTSMSAYDGVYILAAALQKAGTVDDVAKIRAALDGLTLSDVPKLVELLKPQDGNRIFANRQAYFVLVTREWSNGAFHPAGFVG
jgi:branched-chain amino acid transport system substrate-binding protein